MHSTHAPKAPPFSCLAAVEFPGGDWVVGFLGAWFLTFGADLFFAGDLLFCLQVAFLTVILDLLVG